MLPPARNDIGRSFDDAGAHVYNVAMPDDNESVKVSRRAVMATSALVPAAMISAAANPAPVFSPSQKLLLEAFVDRLVPRDEIGPGAADCGVVNYIERLLADAQVAEKTAFLEGLAAVDAFARSKYENGFTALPPVKQDEALAALEGNLGTGFASGSRAYFLQVRRLTLEGMFSDPYYGGNRKFAGWDLIRYPGPRLAVTPDDQRMREAIKPVRLSAYGGNHGH